MIKESAKKNITKGNKLELKGMIYKENIDREYHIW